MAKIMLFDGTSLELWRKPDGEPSNWTLHADGTMSPSRDDTVSTVTFKDAHIHVEFREPLDSERTEEIQFQDGNSGVYIHGCYEIQIIDSYGDAPIKENPCGAIYMMYHPRVNASKAVGEWQYYDIYFRAPRFSDKGEISECARVTVIHNGEVIQNNVVLHQATPGGIYEYPVAEGPLMLQGYRWDPVKFRNVWIETL
jgi:hypothetical protein